MILVPSAKRMCLTNVPLLIFCVHHEKLHGVGNHVFASHRDRFWEILQSSSQGTFYVFQVEVTLVVH